LTKVIKTLAPILFCAIMMGVTVSALNRFVLSEFSNFQQLIISIPVGAVSYAIFLFLFGNSRVKDIKNSLADSVLGEKIIKVKKQIRVNISNP
jgi:low affinity Fe/Cu permease